MMMTMTMMTMMKMMTMMTTMSSTQDRPTNLNYVNPHHTQSNLNEFPGEGPDRAGKDPIRGHDQHGRHRHNGTASTREDKRRPRSELRGTPELPTTQREDRRRPRSELRGTPELPTTQRYCNQDLRGLT